jgi:hypothetical protein
MVIPMPASPALWAGSFTRSGDQSSLLREASMQSKESRLHSLSQVIRASKVSTFDDILARMACSTITLRRDLNSLKGITSYTHRGTYVTLPDIPAFDETGIRFCKGVGFTTFKNSFELIVNTINEAKNGITREELEAMLRIKISKQIQILMEKGRLHRVKLGAKYCYISAELAKDKNRQFELLGVDIEDHIDKKVRLVDLVAVLKVVLAEHEIDIKNLKKLVRKYSLDVPVQKVEQLILTYDLTSKKKHSTFCGI